MSPEALHPVVCSNLTCPGHGFPSDSIRDVSLLDHLVRQIFTISLVGWSYRRRWLTLNTDISDLPFSMPILCWIQFKHILILSKWMNKMSPASLDPSVDRLNDSSCYGQAHSANMIIALLMITRLFLLAKEYIFAILESGKHSLKSGLRWSTNVTATFSTVV